MDGVEVFQNNKGGGYSIWLFNLEIKHKKISTFSLDSSLDSFLLRRVLKPYEAYPLGGDEKIRTSDPGFSQMLP